MERLVCFSVEGLKRLSGREVWMPIGNYATVGEAQAAAGGLRGEVLETRIVSCYRVTPPLGLVSVAARSGQTTRPQSSLHVEA